MKLTETQRNFRKEMREIQKEFSPYDNSRDGNPFHRQVGGFGLVLLLIIAVPVYKFLFTAKIPELPAFVSETNVSGSNVTASAVNFTDGAIPPNEAMLLKQIFRCELEITQQWDEIAKHHKIPYKKRNQNEYRKALVQGIVVSDKWLLELNNMENSQYFGELFNITRDFVRNSNLAFKYYLNYLNNQNPSDLDVANNYLRLLNENYTQRKEKFRQILDQNNFRYEVLNDGSIRYWIQN